MPLCETCRNIDFVAVSQSRPREILSGPIQRFPSELDIFGYKCDDDITTSDSILLYHETVDDLKAAAQLCDLCRLVMASVEKVLASMAKAKEKRFNYILEGHQLWMCGTFMGDGVEILGLSRSPKNKLELYIFCGLRFSVAEDSAFGDVIEGRTHPISPTDPRTIEKMIGWLEKADEEDGDFISSSRLPSRLLKITEGGATVSLVKPTDETTKYAALSHCWGSVRLTTLSTDSFDQLKNGVRTSSLPQSFQDAVWVTHLLGAQYLWIDSLCIFQDSLQDWTHESAKMRDIYENSWLTIAASRASSSIQGFLGNHERPDCTSIAYRQGSVSEEVQISTVPIRQVSKSERNANLDDEPLTGRGWTLQERFLPRRILHFSRSQILFEHHRIIWAQDKRGPIHLHYASRGFEDFASWHELVEQYSTRRLTKETDKLPAIGGLAAYFAPILSYDEHSTYLAGLWRKDLLAGLCWSLDRYCTPRPRPKSYRAPSWSWASIDGKVEHSLFSDELAIIEEAHTSLLSPANPFGEVQAGWIRLRAIVLRPSSHRAFKGIVFRFFEKGNKFNISVAWDSEPCSDTTTNRSADLSEDETGLHFMPMLWNKSVSLTDKTVFGPEFIVMKRCKHVIAQHSNLRGFERVGFGTALCHRRDPDRGTKEGLFKLVSDGWTKMMLTGQLEEIILV